MAAGRPKIKGGKRIPTVAMLTPKQRRMVERAAVVARLSLSGWLTMLVDGYLGTGPWPKRAQKNL